jgi:hypothetical protein
MHTYESDDDILSYVRVLSRTKSKRLREELVGSASARILKTICNFCYNALYNSALKSHADKCKTLRNSKTVIRILATRRVGVREKRRILARQSGSFLREVVPAVSEALGTNLHDVVSR